MRGNPTSLAALTCAAFLLSACGSMAPTYERPVAPVPHFWPMGDAYAPATSNLTQKVGEMLLLPSPNQFLLDARLQRVVALALRNSRDVRGAVVQVEAARAQYRVQRAAQWPGIDAGLNASRAKSRMPASASDSRGAAISESAGVTVGVSSFELDLFGRVRSLSDAALESYLATEEARRTAQIALVAETAGAWMTLASDRSLLGLARQTEESARRSVEITRRRLEAGVASRLDVRQAETVWHQARTDILRQTTAIAQDLNALELLVGAGVDATLLPEELPQMTGNSLVLAEVAAGLSSEVLLQRPDVLQAEHELKSANANIGAARAAFFPRLSLTASAGIASTSLSRLFNDSGSVWSFAPALTLPIFDGGTNRANLAYSRAQQQIALNNYERSVQTAFREVADALARQGTLAGETESQTSLVEASRDSFKLAQARYEGSPRFQCNK